MLEMLLSKLPFILTAWTSTLLCWGVYLNILMFKTLKLPATLEMRHLRVCNFGCTALANVILILYLVFEPQLARTIGDAIIVINVFYTAFLVFASLVLPEWFKSTKP